jgi:ferredoxin--NADP+ reductase
MGSAPAKGDVRPSNRQNWSPNVRFAVVGAGPSGLYAADELVRRATAQVSVDVIDRLPAPYGLVRYGVAPDHLTIKSIVSTLRKILERDEVRLLGNIDVGRVVSADALARCYDAVIYATGAPLDKHLGIPGEELPGSHAARELVEWYSGHPDSYSDFVFDNTAVAIIGSGNVALDLARILVRPPEELTGTDIPDPVLRRLLDSEVREVHIVARRGPEAAKFTPKELRELVGLDRVSVAVEAADLPAEQQFDASRNVLANLAILRRQACAENSHERRVFFHFHARPIAVEGNVRVEGLRIERSRDVGNASETVIPVSHVFRAVGYAVGPIENLAFDPDRGLIPHERGRVAREDGGSPQYIVGWLKRGPSGVIGTNRADAVETVEAVLADLRAGALQAPVASFDKLLAELEIRPVTYAGWLGIDEAELERGQNLGRDRVKLHEWPDLLRVGLTNGKA